MADSIETGFDVTLHHPLCRAFPGQCFETLLDSVGTGAFFSEPVRVQVRLALCDGVKSRQVESLHRSIFHRRNTEGAFLAVRFRDVQSPQGEGLVTSLLERVYRLHLQLWRVPQNFVHASGFLAVIFRHSSHGKSLAAKRVGKQILQGLHLAPFAFLPSLHDTRLEPTHVFGDGLPVYGLPLPVYQGGRINRLCKLYRHLLSRLDRFAKLSRVGRPVGSLPAFAPDDVSIGIRPITVRHSLFPTSPTRIAIANLAVLLPLRERYGLTTFLRKDRTGWVISIHRWS